MRQYIILLVFILAATYSYSQNTAAKPDSILTYAANGKMYEKEYCKYDNQGALISKTVENDLWKTNIKYVYENNEKGLPLTEYQYKLNEKTKERDEYWQVVFKYDGKDNLIATTNLEKSSKGWDQRIRYENEYKKKDEVLTTGYHSNGKVYVESRAVSKYDPKNKEKLLTKTVYYRRNNKWKEVEYYYYKYDEVGRLESEEYHDKKEDDNQTMFRYVYEYDSSNRLKKKSTNISQIEVKEWSPFNYSLYYY